MIDMTSDSLPAYEQVIEKKLIQCGLAAGSFTVKYEAVLQSIEIAIDKQAGASDAILDCIVQATIHEIVTFRDGEMQKKYDNRAFEAFKPKMLADARAALQKRGLLENFPERPDYASDKLFVEALERHCGIKPGTYLVQGEHGLILQPKSGGPQRYLDEKARCLFDAVTFVMAKGVPLKISVIGNQALPPSQ